MTRIQSFCLCLTWLSLVVASGGPPPLQGHASFERVQLNDLLHTEAFRGRSLQDLEELTLQELEEAKRSLLQGGDDHEAAVEPGDNKIVPGYFATPAPTQAPMPGDFAQLNELLRTTVLSLPDTDIQEMLLFQLLSIGLRNMECTQVSFDDIQITPDLRSKQEVGVDFGLVNLGLQCEFDFQWSYIFLVGNGHAVVQVGDSSANGGMDFFSQDFDMFPPESAQVTSCMTDINILGLDFSGNIASEIFNLFSQAIVDVLNSLLNDMICGEMKESGAELIGDALDLLYQELSPFLEPVQAWRYDVSYPESTMEVPEDVTLVSWNDDSTYGEFMNAAMDEMEYALGTLLKDENAPNETLVFPNGTAYPEGYDLGINVFLREYMLDDDRSLTVNVSDMADMNQSTTLFTMHDQLTETNISLVELKLHGLDTFTVMEPFQKIGNFTLQNALSWDYLHFDITIRIEMRASSLGDSLVRDPERVEPYVEEIRATVGVEDIQTVISILVALDPQRITALQLGSMLDLVSMLPCLLSSLHEVSLAGLNFTVGDVRMPTGEGMVSPGVDRVLKDGIDLAFFMFKGTILKVIPSLFQSVVRDLVTDTLHNITCPPLELDKEDSFIDLRDLLLDRAEAEEAGASGESPYGDLTSSVYGIAKGLWEEVEEDGTLGLNSIAIEPITEAISGVEGRFQLPGVLFNFTTNEENQNDFKELVDRFEVVFYNLRVDNLDTVVHPMAVWQPDRHPYITKSQINMGPIENAPINATISLLMALDIDNSPASILAQDNIVDLGVSVSSIEVFTELLTMISKNNLLGFKLAGGFNPSCIFAVVTPPKLNHNGYRIEGTQDQGIEMRRFLAKISDLQLHFDCVQCSPGLASLSDMADIMDRSKVTDVLSYRIPLFAEEIAISEVLQVAFDRWLIDAPHQCPHRPEYDPDYERPKSWDTPWFTHLSVEASDTIFFTCAAAAEVAFVLLVETHYPWELDTLAPLSSQENFIAPEGSQIFNFTNLTGTFDDMINDARDYLSEVRIDSETKDEDLGVNLLFRDFGTLDAFNRSEIDFVSMIQDEPIEFYIEGVVFLIHSIKVRGLDSFTRLDAVKPIADQTVLNSMHLEYLEIDVEMGTGSRTAEQRPIVMSFKMKDINATLPLFAAIDLNVLQSLELGHFMLGWAVLPCFLTAAVDIHMPQMLFSLGELSTPTFTGFLQDSGDALKASMEEVFEKYGNRSLHALPIMFDTSARTFLNTFLREYIDDKANCTHIVDYTHLNTTKGEELYPYSDYIDFRELLLTRQNSTALGGAGDFVYGGLLQGLLGPIQEEVLWTDPKTGLASINELLAPIGEVLSGEEGNIIVPASMLWSNITLPIDYPTYMNVSMGFGDLLIENIDTVGAPLLLMVPKFMRPFHLQNSAGIGMGGRPISVSLPFSVEIIEMDDDMEITSQEFNEMTVKLSLNDATALFDTMALISENKTVHFPMKDMFNAYCWLSLVPAPKLNEYGIKEEGEISYISLSQVAVSVSKMNLTLDCVNCTSIWASNLVKSFSSPGAVESLTDIANDVLRVASNLVTGNLVQDNLDRFFNEVGRRCPHHPDYIDDENLLRDILDYKALVFNRSVPPDSLIFLLAGVVLSLAVSIAIISTVLRWIVNRRHQKWLRTLPVQKVHVIQHLQAADDQLERELNEHTSSMITSKEIPAWVRWLMPAIILGNCAMFLSGHLSPAADVVMTFFVAGEELPFEDFYSFSIIKSVVDVWAAGAQFMAIFLLTFAGVWPYTKQLLSLICWVAPTERLSISTRGNVYLWLDILAKWSMMDVMTILLFMIAFRVESQTPDIPFLPENFLSIDFYIQPKWGMYANLIAQMISQISSHFIVYYHRSIVRRATRAYEARHAVLQKPKTVDTADESDERSDGSSMEKVRLCDGAFARPHKGESSKLIARQIASYGLVVGISLLTVFLILGSALKLVSVEIQGLMSYVTGENMYKEYSLFDIAVQFYEDALNLGGFKSIAGHLLLGGVLVLTVFVVPVLQALALAYHWFKPMNDKQRKRFSEIIEILSAWQYTDVFILATLVAVWQQGQTSEGITQALCYDFDTIFNMLAYYGILGKEKAHCLRVESTILTGLYFMIAAAVLLQILNDFVMKANLHHFWDKECTRKEDAMDQHLTLSEARSPVDDGEYKKIRPPPVLFTDSFRWLMRAEHLGDRPLKGEEPLSGLVVEDHGAELDLVDSSSSMASSTSWQPKESEVSMTKSVEDSMTRSAESEPKNATVIDVDDLLPFSSAEDTDVYC